MEKNAVKNFSEMAVEVLGDVATDFLAKSKLGFDALERCLVDAHSLGKVESLMIWKSHWRNPCSVR